MIILHQTIEPLFVKYCTYFNGNKDYFECHEVLEELWKDVAPGDKRHALVGLIQVATALYHWRRENFRGATKSLTSAIAILEQQLDAPYFELIDVELLLEHCRLSWRKMEENDRFEAFSLAFLDEKFACSVAQGILELPLLDEAFVVNKHSLRDRSDVIAARAERLAEKGI